MGPSQERETKLFHYGINLEKRVRPNNPLRQIDAVVDFRFVRDEVKELYGSDGHESEDPIVIMKLMLLLFLDNVSSERELMRIVAERMDYLWLALVNKVVFEGRIMRLPRNEIGRWH